MVELYELGRPGYAGSRHLPGRFLGDEIAKIGSPEKTAPILGK